MDDRPRRVELALGGGGGKGAAHLGVLDALETLGVPVDALAGTSVGGLVAALYGAGFRPDEIAEWLGHATLRRILDRDPGNSGLIGTHKIAALLGELLGAMTFADVRVPLALVAVDLIRRREVVLREGPLVDAILATTALPGIFPPVVRGGELLVDGGILNNVPVDVAGALGAGRVIAVDLGTLANEFSLGPGGALDIGGWSPRRWFPRRQYLVIERAVSIMTAQLSAERLARTPPPVLLRPDVARVAPLSFTHRAEARLAGRRSALAERTRLDAVREWRLGGAESVTGEGCVGREDDEASGHPSAGVGRADGRREEYGPASHGPRGGASA
jgi:NTE family protein